MAEDDALIGAAAAVPDGTTGAVKPTTATALAMDTHTRQPTAVIPLRPIMPATHPRTANPARQLPTRENYDRCHTRAPVHGEFLPTS